MLPCRIFFRRLADHRACFPEKPSALVKNKSYSIVRPLISLVFRYLFALYSFFYGMRWRFANGIDDKVEGPLLKADAFLSLYCGRLLYTSI